jgi:hypothetical protein
MNFNGSLDLSVPVVGFSRTASDGRTWADPVAGLKARHRIDDKWSIEFETDAGGYSKSATAQGYGGVRIQVEPVPYVERGLPRFL